MSYYKSIRIINGKHKLIIVDDDNNIVRNPTKEQMQVAVPEDISSYRKSKLRQKLKGRRCCNCGSDKTYIKNDGNPQWHSCECRNQDCTRYLCKICYVRLQSKEEWRKRSKNRPNHIICCECGNDISSGNWCRRYNENGDWDGLSWICSMCYARIRSKHPDSFRNLMKSMSKHCNKELSKDSCTGKGFIGERIFARVRGLKNCNEESDNFAFRGFDLSLDSEYGRIQCKLKKYHNRGWRISIGMDHDFDNLGIICMGEDMKYVERVYIIPEIWLYGITGITIYDTGIKWEKFRINDIKPYNESYSYIMSNLKNCSVLKFENIQQY